jgi:arylsulfatase
MVGREPFKGTIDLDIRDSEPDWSPFEPPNAPDGAPNVVYIVLDDVGFSAMSCYGGPIETPNIDRIGRGFERWYGFLGAETNQWYPDLVYDGLKGSLSGARHRPPVGNPQRRRAVTVLPHGRGLRGVPGTRRPPHRTFARRSKERRPSWLSIVRGYPRRSLGT